MRYAPTQRLLGCFDRNARISMYFDQAYDRPTLRVPERRKGKKVKIGRQRRFSHSYDPGLDCIRLTLPASVAYRSTNVDYFVRMMAETYDNERIHNWYGLVDHDTGEAWEVHGEVHEGVDLTNEVLAS